MIFLKKHTYESNTYTLIIRSNTYTLIIRSNTYTLITRKLCYLVLTTILSSEYFLTLRSVTPIATLIGFFHFRWHHPVSWGISETGRKNQQWRYHLATHQGWSTCDASRWKGCPERESRKSHTGHCFNAVWWKLCPLHWEQKTCLEHQHPWQTWCQAGFEEWLLFWNCKHPRCLHLLTRVIMLVFLS